MADSSAGEKIITALFTRMAAFTGVASTRIAWPGVDFTPPASGTWVEVKHFPSEPDNPWLGNDEPVDFTGYMQVTACGKKGQGIMPVKRVADDVVGHFPKGTKMTSNGVLVKIERQPGALSVIEDNGQIRIPVPVRYRAIA